ncbi:MAG TPA: GDSL-type esterase/lipase family protein [Prolixibacteraceae bacterium]|nr:GDSL-type esterase/lipase family protein [Prolixibacteraceae bacterium]
MKLFKETSFIILLFTTLIQTACNKAQPIQFASSDQNIVYAGRVEQLENEVVLIGSASSATAWFEGDTCIVFLRNYNNNGLHNYYSIELDGEDLGRFRIEGEEMQAIKVNVTFKKDVHKISVYKSTEASNGYINFGGIYCYKLLEPIDEYAYTIEFIGNSITCGMGNDTLNIPCGDDQWYDQHNAYWAYGPTVSRALKVNFLLSSVSGIGIYRNWNDVGPTMPEVYENLYLDLNSNKKRDFSKYSPNIVSIALGTNDFSDGDGVNERLPFNEEQFTQSYISFVESILSHYPQTQITLLSSPMVSGEKNQTFLSCLNKVKTHFESIAAKPIVIFEFENIKPHGCDYHPDINDHMMMAEQLYPFYSNLLTIN